MIRCVVALGNPGFEYAATRHNIAWQLLEFLPFFAQIKWKKKYLGRFGTTEVDGERLCVLKPETYMNLSGNGVGLLVKDHGFAPEEILVIHDDIELNFGVVSFKINGGLGGHNGLRSIASRLNSREFNRFRLGISRPQHGDITEHVLSDFSPQERVDLPRYLETAASLLHDALATSVELAIEKYGKIDLLSS
jgi:PTH1 family peptidyl-tRNA hydrolase